MKISYYPGCSLEGTAKSFNNSTKRVCDTLGITIEEIPDWSCCGSSPALKMDGLLSVSLAAHNLIQASRQQLSSVVIPCPFCFRRLLSAKEEMAQDPKLKARVHQVTNGEIEETLQVDSLLGFMFNRVGLEAMAAMVKKPLKGLKVVPYYGCYLVKPAGVTHFDDPESPKSMDKILAVLGAEVLEWDFKTECCGAGLSLSKTKTVSELAGRIIREAAWRRADAIVVACQLCQANLDLLQENIGRMHGMKYRIPVIYFTQIMGLAFGHTPHELGLDHHLVGAKDMLKKKGLLS